MKKILINLAIVVNLLLTIVSSLKAEDNKILIIVNSGIYSSISSSIASFKAKLSAEGYNVFEIKSWVKTKKGDGIAAADIRKYIKDRKEGLKGVILIGNLPYAKFKKSASSIFSTDLFYMDLDGDWTLNGNYYTAHSGNTNPEIWVSRLTANTISGSSESVFLKNYFNKNINYRSQGLASNGKGLSYSDKRPSLSKLFGSAKADSISNKTKYKEKYKENYGLLHFAGTGSSNCKTITFASGGTADKTSAKESKSLFYNLLDVSKIGSFKQSNYLSGHYLFNNDYCLAVLANSSSNRPSFSSDETLYNSLYADGDGTKPLGDAFLAWLKENLSTSNYGLLILGDGTLTMAEVLNDGSSTGSIASADSINSQADQAVAGIISSDSDTTAPSGSISINSGTSAYTKSTTVTLTLSAQDDAE